MLDKSQSETEVGELNEPHDHVPFPPSEDTQFSSDSSTPQQTEITEQHIQDIMDENKRLKHMMERQSLGRSISMDKFF